MLCRELNLIILPLLFALARSSSPRSVLLTSVWRGLFCFLLFGYASLLIQFSARKLRSRHFGKDYLVVEVTDLFIVIVWRLAVHRRSVYLFLSRLKDLRTVPAPVKCGGQGATSHLRLVASLFGVCIFSFVRLCLGGCLGSVSSGVSTSSVMAGGGASMWWSSEFPLCLLFGSIQICYGFQRGFASKRHRSDFGGSVATLGDDSSGFYSLRMLAGGNFSDC
ncbi:unnamed protein product [Brassica rapa]|uniref:DUF4220 domain-containing protein n=1 Tax=Brassica campestris TaxID=3711 RepID=A0A8D9HJV7_BRACM|nr:unnamed protein product [Brassica rapa]